MKIEGPRGKNFTKEERLKESLAETEESLKESNFDDELSPLEKELSALKKEIYQTKLKIIEHEITRDEEKLQEAKARKLELEDEWEALKEKIFAVVGRATSDEVLASHISDKKRREAILSQLVTLGDKEQA